MGEAKTIDDLVMSDALRGELVSYARFLLDWESDDKDSCISHLKNGSIFLELFSYKKSQKLNKKNLGDDLRQIGIKHFGLKVESINKAKEKIIQAGLAKKEDVEIKQGRTGIVYFFLQDPDGNFVEIVEDNRVFNLA